MSTRSETILAAAAAALAGTAGVASRIYRSRVEAFARRETPALVVEPISSIASEQTVGRTLWTLTFMVATIVRADAPETTADPIMIEVHNRIMADTTIEALAVERKPAGITWQFEEADVILGVVLQQFIVSYITNSNSLEA